MKGCKNCPAYAKCTVTYRGSACAALRSTYGIDSDPEIITNADRIRDMSDEELAKFLCNFRSCDSSEHPCNGCQAEPYCMIGHNGMIDWLQKPVEDCEACHDGVCDIPGVIVQDEATEFTRDQWNWLLGRFTREE